MPILFISRVPSFGSDVTWSPMDDSGQLQYLQIDSPDVMNMKETTSTGHAEFWQSLPIHEPRHNAGASQKTEL